MLHETDLAKQRALMFQYDKRVLDEETHYIHTLLVEPAGAAALLRPRLEDRPESLLEPGSRDDLAVIAGVRPMLDNAADR